MSEKKIPTSLFIVEKYFERKGITDEYAEIPIQIHIRGEIVSIRKCFSVFPTPIASLIVEYTPLLNYLPTDVRSYHVSLSRARLDIIENMDSVDNIREIITALLSHWGFRDSTGFYPLDSSILLAGSMKDVLFQSLNLPTPIIFDYLFNLMRATEDKDFEHKGNWPESSASKLFWKYFSYFAPGSKTNRTIDMDKVAAGIVRNCSISNPHLQSFVGSLSVTTAIFKYKDLNLFKQYADEQFKKHPSSMKHACEMCLQDQGVLLDRGIRIPNGTLLHLIRTGILYWAMDKYGSHGFGADSSPAVLEKIIRAIESSWSEFKMKMKTKCKFPIEIGTLDGTGTYIYPGGGTKNYLPIYSWIFHRFADKRTYEISTTLDCPHWGEEAFCGIAFPCPSHV